MIDITAPSGAVFSQDKRFRYCLWRKWGHPGGKFIMFVGLNPSKADATYNDLTITKLIHFSKQWGYDGLFMANLFSYIESDSAFIRRLTPENMNNFIGAETDTWLKFMWESSAEVVFCWGDFKNVSARSQQIRDTYGPAMCFGRCKSGAPKHPVRLGYATELDVYV